MGTRKKFWVRMVEDVLVTAALSGIGVLLTDLEGVDFKYAIIVIPVLQAVKGLLSKNVGEYDSPRLT
jgi:hypothetical protein